MKASAMHRHALWIARAMARPDLSPLSADDVRLIQLASQPKKVTAGTLLMGVGDDVDGVFIVADGEVELAYRRLVGRRTVALVRRGGVIGDIPLFCDKPMPLDAVASRDSVLFELSREGLLELLKGSPSIALGWITSIAKRMEDNQRRILTVLTKDLPGQVATVLLDEREPGPAGTSKVQLSQAVVAQLLGVHRQAISRVLGKLRAQGVLRTGYREIILLDVEALARAAGETAVTPPCGQGAGQGVDRPSGGMDGVR